MNLERQRNDNRYVHEIIEFGKTTKCICFSYGIILILTFKHLSVQKLF